MKTKDYPRLLGKIILINDTVMNKQNRQKECRQIMAWNYAELSKLAKEAGGPEKLMNFLIESGKSIGRKEMIPVVGIAAGIGVLGCAGINKLVKVIKIKGEISLKAVDTVKKELIQGIKDYDVELPYSEDDGNNQKMNENNK